jgi:hypothetical protein
MKRRQLPELEDQRWFPQMFRNLITDLLQHQLIAWRIYTPAVPLIRKTMNRHDCHHIVDLCSGAGGPLLQLHHELTDGDDVTPAITLTDKFPSIAAFRNARAKSKDGIQYISDSVDATRIPKHLKGLRTLFSSFHHFKPDKAKQILQNAADDRSPIAIFEFTERRLFTILAMPLFAPLSVLLTTPFIRPFSWRRLLWTYIIPVAPLIYAWDSTISHLRTYSPGDLTRLLSEVRCNNYRWEIGRIKQKKRYIQILYLIGHPQSNPPTQCES